MDKANLFTYRFVNKLTPGFDPFCLRHHQPLESMSIVADFHCQETTIRVLESIVGAPMRSYLVRDFARLFLPCEVHDRGSRTEKTLGNGTMVPRYKCCLAPRYKCLLSRAFF